MSLSLVQQLCPGHFSFPTADKSTCSAECLRVMVSGIVQVDSAYCNQNAEFLWCKKNIGWFRIFWRVEERCASGSGVERHGALTTVEASLDPPGASCQLSSGDKEPTMWEIQSERIAWNSQPAVRRVCTQCVLPSPCS